MTLYNESDDLYLFQKKRNDCGKKNFDRWTEELKDTSNGKHEIFSFRRYDTIIHTILKMKRI